VEEIRCDIWVHGASLADRYTGLVALERFVVELAQPVVGEALDSLGIDDLLSSRELMEDYLNTFDRVYSRYLHLPRCENAGGCT